MLNVAVLTGRCFWLQKKRKKSLNLCFRQKKVQEKWETFARWPLFAALKLLQWRKTFLNKFQGCFQYAMWLTGALAQMEYWRIPIWMHFKSGSRLVWYLTHIAAIHSTSDLYCWPNISNSTDTHIWLSQSQIGKCIEMWMEWSLPSRWNLFAGLLTRWCCCCYITLTSNDHYCIAPLERAAEC